MIAIKKPAYEEQRIETLKKYDIVYTPKEKAFEDIVLFASQICDMPIALITLINQDEVWFKASIGLGDKETTAREFSVCSHTINNTKDITEFEDLSEDNRFFDFPIVVNENIMFYAGVPLVSPNGMPLGTISVMDRKKRKLTIKQKKALKALASQVMIAMDNRLTKELVERNISLIERKNYAIEEFTNMAMENMTSPLNTITLLSEMIEKNCSQELSERLTGYLDIIKDSSDKMITLLNEVKEFYQNLDLITAPKEHFFIDDLLNEIIKSDNSDTQVTYSIADNSKKIFANRIALKKILETKIGDCSDQNSTEGYKISISFQTNKDSYLFILRDNGTKYKEKNNGLNLDLPTFKNKNSQIECTSIAQTLIHALGGDFSIDFTKEGNVIRFYIAR